MPSQRSARPAIDRLLDRVKEDHDCWIWQGASSGKRGLYYGLICTGSRTDDTRKRVQTHRLAYEYFISDIPEGLVLDHLCRQTLCCNPWHLEPVSQGVNNRRAVWSPEAAARRIVHASTMVNYRWAAA